MAITVQIAETSTTIVVNTGRGARGASASESSYSTTFTNSDLSVGVLTVTHGLNKKYVCGVAIYDNNDEQVGPGYTITAIDADSLTVDLSGFGTLTGTWTAVIL